MLSFASQSSSSPSFLQKSYAETPIFIHHSSSYAAIGRRAEPVGNAWNTFAKEATFVKKKHKCKILSF